MPEDFHFKGREAIQHVAEVQAQGIIESTELHGTEPPGYLSAAADAIRDAALFILLIWIPFSYFQIPKTILFALVAGWMIWKCGRSAWLGWSRLERLHRVLEQERWEIQHHRPQEREEMRALYTAKGLEGKLLENVLDVLMADDNRLLRIMIEEEMGISLETHDHPLKQALGSFVGVLFSAMLCFLGYLVHPYFGPPFAALISVSAGAWLSAHYAQNRLIPSYGMEHRHRLLGCWNRILPIYFVERAMNTSTLNTPEPTASLLFEEFFELGKVETFSPFLDSRSRRWGAHLSLKTAILSAILLLFSFIASFYSMPISYILLMGVYFLAGIPALIESLEALGSFEVNIDILMTIAAFSSVIIGSGMEGGLLLVLFALSGSMEDFVTSKAKKDISSLHKLAPTKACVVKADGTIFERAVKEVEVGTHILIRAGQLAPLDGIVIDGISEVNLVHITGESIPIPKKIGDIVPAGARNTEGTLTLRVTHTSADSTLARIIQLVTQAQEERPMLQRWFDKLSRGYAIILMSLAAILSLLMPYFLSIPFIGPEGSIYRSLAFLIAASPCALIIAIPIAYLSAIGVCARQGILLKGGIALDAIARCKTIIFDKTGTLTTGELSLTKIEAIGESSDQDIKQAIAVAYALEKNAIHPIAKAITTYGHKVTLSNIPIEEFKAIPGYGLKAIAKLPQGSQEVYIGHADYILSKVNVDLGNAINSHVLEAKNSGELVAILLIGEKPYLLRFQDTLRKGIARTIEELKNMNLRLVILTGDNEESAYRIVKELHLDEYYANLRPEDKLHYVSQLTGKEDVAMVGDGVNDAPALARATVGLCMGKVGSTAAIDAADVILLQDNIELLGWLFKKAHQTQGVVVQNLILATLAILVASLPALAGFVPLWLAVVMHEGGTVLVGLNGLRLLKR